MRNSGRPLLGIFGGTFDPIHYGHLRVAEEIGEMADLREVRVIPAGMPRLRADPVASLHHRVAMVHLATARHKPDRGFAKRNQAGAGRGGAVFHYRC